MPEHSPYSNQLNLADQLRQVEQDERRHMRETRLEREFRKFHAENPHVYVLLVRFAHQALAAGFEHYSIDAIFQRARWHATIETKDQDGFKLNDHHRAYYARLIDEQEPLLRGFFRMRVVEGER